MGGRKPPAGRHYGNVKWRWWSRVGWSRRRRDALPAIAPSEASSRSRFHHGHSVGALPVPGRPRSSCGTPTAPSGLASAIGVPPGRLCGEGRRQCHRDPGAACGGLRRHGAVVLRNRRRAPPAAAGRGAAPRAGQAFRCRRKGRRPVAGAQAARSSRSSSCHYRRSFEVQSVLLQCSRPADVASRVADGPPAGGSCPRDGRRRPACWRACQAARTLPAGAGRFTPRARSDASYFASS